MYIDQLNTRIFLKVFPEFHDVNVHAAGVEIAVVMPDLT